MGIVVVSLAGVTIMNLDRHAFGFVFTKMFFDLLLYLGWILAGNEST